MESTADPRELSSGKDGSLSELLSSAVEKLREGVLDEAHRLLVRLIRKHNNDGDVIFNLAVARKRLGYDVSAEALFAQAFDHGYRFPPDSQPVPVPGQRGLYRWTDATGTVCIEVRERPRRASLLFVGFAEPQAAASTQAAVDAPPASVAAQGDATAPAEG